MKHLGALIINIVIISLMAMGTSSCTSHADASLDNRAADSGAAIVAPVNVKTEAVEFGRLTESLHASGQTIADRDVLLSAETAGRIEHMDAKLGQPVKKGQVLVRIDYAMLKAQRDQAQASFNLTEKTFNRLNQLRSEELVSQQSIDEAESSMIQAKAMLKIAQVNLNRSVVRATTDGVITEKHVEKGEYVGPGTPLFRVVDIRHIVVTADIPESKVGAIKPGAPVSVRLDALGRTIESRVQVVLPAAHPASRTYQMRVQLDNSDGRILVGMAANLSITLKTYEDVVVASQDVVLEEENGRSVFVRDGDVARKRAVSLGAVDGDRVVLVDGVEQGDELIVVGMRDLVDGQPVRLVTN